MTAYLAGIALMRCAEHERADEISATARLTLAAMASFVGKGEWHAREPRCLASHQAIARRANLSDRSVIRAQKALAELHLIERYGRVGDAAGQMNSTVRWRLLLLHDDARPGEPAPGTGGDTESDKSRTSTRGDTLSDKSPDTESDKGSDSVSPNPSDPVATPRERKGRGRSDSAVAPPLPGGRGCAAESSTENTLVDEVRETLRCSREHAERYIERTLDGRTVHNPFAYIRQSLRNHQDAAATSPKPKGTGKAAGSGKGTGKGTDRSAPVRSGTGTGSGSGRGRRTTHEERAEAVAALQEGRETVADVTARLGSSPITVKAWWADADRKAAFHAVRNGEDVADVLTRYPRCPRHMEPVLREIAQGNRRAS